MRISAEAKEKTRQRILVAAQRLFSTAGFDQTSTRDLSSEAGIATGTLFNYFPTKESLALAIVADALDKARGDFESRLRPDASLSARRAPADRPGFRPHGCRSAPPGPPPPLGYTGHGWITGAGVGGVEPPDRRRRSDPPGSPGNRPRDHRGPRPGAPARLGPAVLDALPGPARLLVAGRVARTGRHARSAGRIDAPVCPVPRPRQ